MSFIYPVHSSPRVARKFLAFLDERDTEDNKRKRAEDDDDDDADGTPAKKCKLMEDLVADQHEASIGPITSTGEVPSVRPVVAARRRSPVVRRVGRYLLEKVKVIRRKLRVNIPAGQHRLRMPGSFLDDTEILRDLLLREEIFSAQIAAAVQPTTPQQRPLKRQVSEMDTPAAKRMKTDRPRQQMPGAFLSDEEYVRSGIGGNSTPVCHPPINPSPLTVTRTPARPQVSIPQLVQPMRQAQERRGRLRKQRNEELEQAYKDEINNAKDILARRREHLQNPPGPRPRPAPATEPTPAPAQAPPLTPASAVASKIYSLPVVFPDRVNQIKRQAGISGSGKFRMFS
ncbi:hypothetical protein BU24DRAFT_473584 [Aaosphaeria arxii CBS 175.79]|uniref:Uncharacterized protein n=1 Tax=Aaosphaeria arxii CBS 175.79 TaxID=1450172 RepID=A0A6A5X932_9PLEO|nr:uncharacterized protein BU24DRAFT_473584 [Aaosphaeria arxii CBS 175.79]KAF2009433.1 hypothetical protein BU24DRAFT_473584 [Aaosphaeria arxii CBS 175.79]